MGITSPHALLFLIFKHHDKEKRILKKLILLFYLICVASQGYAQHSSSPGPDTCNSLNNKARHECYEKWVREIVVATANLHTTLVKDTRNLGITTKEKAALVAFYRDYEKDVKTRCRIKEYDCRRSMALNAYNQLLEFAKKKIVEKERADRESRYAVPPPSLLNYLE